MKNSLRRIDLILLAAALLFAALCGGFHYALARFSPEKYEAEIAGLNAQTESVRAETLAERSETEKQLAFLRADLRNNGAEASALADRIEKLRAAEAEKEERLGLLQPEARLYDDTQGAIEDARRQYALKIRELEDKILSGESSVRICYLTLDDGPTKITKQFLDAYDELGEHVHVTFFVAYGANESDDEEEMLRRELASGHSVQNHSYSHDYWGNGRVYRSLEGFREQIQLQDDWLYQVTGFRPGIFRFPGGSKMGFYLRPEAEEVFSELGYQWVDWNCNLYDAGENRRGAVEEIEVALYQVPLEEIAVVLGHDWNLATLYASKVFIPKLQEQGYVFLPLFPESAMMGMESKR